MPENSPAVAVVESPKIQVGSRVNWQHTSQGRAWGTVISPLDGGVIVAVEGTEQSGRYYAGAQPVHYVSNDNATLEAPKGTGDGKMVR